MNFKEYVLLLFTLTYFNKTVKAQNASFYSEVVRLSDVNGLIYGDQLEILVSSGSNIIRFKRNETSSPFYSYVFAFNAHDGVITAMHYLPKQEGCITGSTDRSIILWNFTHLGSYLPQLTIMNAHSSSILCFWEIGYARLLLASGSSDGTIKIWYKTTGHLYKTLIGHEDAVTAIFQTDEGTIFSSSKDGTIRMWNYAGEFVNILRSHTDSVNALLNFKGYLVSASSDKSIKIWNYKGDLLKTQMDAHDGSIHALEKFGNYLMTSGSDKTIKLWNLGSDGGKVDIRLKKTLTYNINETVFRLLTVSDKYNLFLSLHTSPYTSFSRLLTWKLDGLEIENSTTYINGNSNGLSDTAFWIIIVVCVFALFGSVSATYTYRKDISC